MITRPASRPFGRPSEVITSGACAPGTASSSTSPWSTALVRLPCAAPISWPTAAARSRSLAPMNTSCPAAITLPTAKSSAATKDQGAPTQGAVPSLKPLTGENLCGPTRLRLLITSGSVPVVLDVDSGHRYPVGGMATDPGRQTWIQPAPGNAALIMSLCDSCGPNASVFSLAPLTTGAHFLGMASDVAPGNDGHSVWLQADSGSLGCLLTQVGLDGRIVGAVDAPTGVSFRDKAPRCGCSLRSCTSRVAPGRMTRFQPGNRRPRTAPEPYLRRRRAAHAHRWDRVRPAGGLRDYRCERAS